ncbi:unnamed protein product [Larinioides sclopetarius]|uniref:Uncharacterized protein n=1 Tax=Larinioides sclopetarius TaxID=280406 RepID=A0AAV2BU20_9ARAC
MQSLFSKLVLQQGNWKVREVHLWRL